MMIPDKIIKIKINPQNRKKYEKRLNKKLEKGQIIEIKQSEVLETSRIKVECICDFCKSTVMKPRVDVTSELTFCNNKCRNEYNKIRLSGDQNPNPRKRVDVNCHVCGKEIEVHESKFKKQNVFLCSWDCYKIHRSKTYKGEKIYNYQHEYVKCAMCGKKIKTSKWYKENKKHLFCSPECYWEHRRRYYIEFYYKDDLNNARDETKPERMVREWLEAKGINFIQECGFLKKYYVDFYLPDYKAIIEVYGDYWHVNPDIYDIYGNDKNKKPINKNQKEFLDSKYDEIRKNELESYGYKVFIIWENDIYNNLDYHMNNIMKSIVNK